MRTKPAVDAPVFVTVMVHVTVLEGFAQSRAAVEGAMVTDRVGDEAASDGVDVT
jgi:hypothetical protein